MKELVMLRESSYAEEQLEYTRRKEYEQVRRRIKNN
jgi:hypothetical protein